MLTISELAKRWNVSANHVRRMIKSGAINAVQISLPGARRKTWRFRMADVEAWEQGRLACRRLSARRPSRIERAVTR